MPTTPPTTPPTQPQLRHQDILALLHELKLPIVSMDVYGFTIEHADRQLGIRAGSELAGFDRQWYCVELPLLPTHDNLSGPFTTQAGLQKEILAWKEKG